MLFNLSAEDKEQVIEEIFLTMAFIFSSVLEIRIKHWVPFIQESKLPVLIVLNPCQAPYPRFFLAEDSAFLSLLGETIGHLVFGVCGSTRLAALNDMLEFNPPIFLPLLFLKARTEAF